MFDEQNEERVPPSAEQLWGMVRRRRWWLLVPFFLCWLAVWAASWLLPTAYQSVALINVEQPKVPEYYVEPNVSANLQGRLQGMTQQVLSRNRLQTIVDNFHLYPSRHGLARFLQAADPVDELRRNIKVELVELPGHPGQFSAFKILYSGDSPALAQQVNSQLATLFIDENVKAEQQLSENTTSFLSSKVAEAREKLEQQEAELESFKASHLGELPNQMQSNAEAAGVLQSQLETIQHSLDAANQQKLYLETQIQQLQSAKAFLGSGDSSGSSPDTIDEELLTLRRKLADDRARYTDDHPEVIALKNKIAETEKLKKDLEAQIATEQKQSAAQKPTDKVAPDPSGSKWTTSALLIQLNSQLKANALEIQNDQHRQKEIQAELATYQTRLKLAPQAEQELENISRGYEESKANYNSLLQKQNQSQLATSLAQRQQGEQFRILDPPSLPDKPSAPNHLLISLGGLVLGAVVGILLVAYLEFTNVQVHHEKDLADVVPARVLVYIPHLPVPGEARLDLASRRMELITAAAMVLLILAGNFYSFYRG